MRSCARAPPLPEIAFQYLRIQALNETGEVGGERVPETFNCYADPLMESLLEHLQPAVEQFTGLQLWPTYSYCRIYQHGDVLESHTDRIACEVSVSLLKVSGTTRTHNGYHFTCRNRECYIRQYVNF